MQDIFSLVWEGALFHQSGEELLQKTCKKGSKCLKKVLN